MSRQFPLTDKQKEGIGTRLNEIVRDRYEQDKEFLKDYGVPAGTLGWWKKGKINIALLIKPSKDFDISLTWLLRGIGPKEFSGERLKKSRESDT